MATTPMTHGAADDAKLYDGPDHDAGHAVPNNDRKPQDGGNGDHGGHEGRQIDIPPIGTGKVILFLVAFAVLFAALFALGWYPMKHDEKLAEADARTNANDKPVVSVANPKPPTTLPSLEVPGDAQALQTTLLYPRTNGYLKKLYVDIGDTVKDGQLLAEIDTPEIDAQLAAADANLQQARAAEQKSKDDFDLTQATYQRYESFAKTGGVTQQQLDEKRSAFTSAKSTLAGAEASVMADEAEVQRLTALQGFEKIYAPFAGTVNTRGYDVGALLNSGGSGGGREIFQISNTTTLRIFVDIPQSYATFIQTGQPVQFAVRNYPGKPFEGYIARTSGSINQQTRTLRVEADFPNKDGHLYPGMYGTLSYRPERQIKYLMIPSSALIYGPEGMRVAVVDDKHIARFKPITLGADLGIDIEVTHGLSDKDKVVTNPGERLTDGVEVDFAKTDADKNLGGKAAGQGQNSGTTPQGTGS